MREKLVSIEGAISRVLDSDADLCLLHVSRFWRDPALFDDIAQFDHDDAEVRFIVVILEMSSHFRL